MTDMPKPILVHQHGNPVALPAGRYWIGDLAVLGYVSEDILDQAREHDLDGLYVQHGLVSGVFCRSLWPDARYAVEIRAEAFAHVDGLRIDPRGPGVSILPVTTDPDVTVDATDPPPCRNGVLVDLPAGTTISRTGHDGGDISFALAEGTVLFRLWILKRSEIA